MRNKESENQKVRFLFVGEKRSTTAQEKNYTWQNCPDVGVLCARKLFEALREAGIEPREHDFINAWEDDGNPQEIYFQGRIVVAMGQRVQDELDKRGIPYIPIIHPAARGTWCRKIEYGNMIRETLTSENIDAFKLET
jgi:hypothetical protein